MLPIEYVIFFIIHSLLLGITVEKYILSTQKYQISKYLDANLLDCIVLVTMMMMLCDYGSLLL